MNEMHVSAVLDGVPERPSSAPFEPALSKARKDIEGLKDRADIARDDIDQLTRHDNRLAQRLDDLTAAFESTFGELGNRDHSYSAELEALRADLDRLASAVAALAVSNVERLDRLERGSGRKARLLARLSRTHAG